MITSFPVFKIEDQKEVELKRQAYIDGYKQAIKDMQKRLKNLQTGSELFTTSTTTYSQKMVDVTLPESVLKKLTK